MFEHRSHQLVSPVVFFRRLACHGSIAALVIGVSLCWGAFCYHTLEGLPWIDAVLEAAMILTGMGPLHQLNTVAGKIFATGYALYSGLIFIIVTGILLAPVAHRVLHRFHLELEREDAPGE